MTLVNIINCTIGGTYFLEGQGRVVGDVKDEPDQKWIDFGNGHGAVQRFVDPCAQDHNVGTYIERLNDTQESPR